MSAQQGQQSLKKQAGNGKSGSYYGLQLLNLIRVFSPDLKYFPACCVIVILPAR